MGGCARVRSRSVLSAIPAAGMLFNQEQLVQVGSAFKAKNTAYWACMCPARSAHKKAARRRLGGWRRVRAWCALHLASTAQITAAMALQT